MSTVVDLSLDAAAKFVSATIEERQGNAGRIHMLVWETASGKIVWETEWENEAAFAGGLSSRNSAVLDPSGSRLVVIRGTFEKGPEDPDTSRFTGSTTSDVKLYKLSTKELLARLDSKDSVAATFPYSGKHVYLSGRGIVRWDPANGEQTWLSDHFVKRLIVTPTDERLIALELTLPKPGAIHWIDPKTRQEVYHVPNAEMRYSVYGVHLTDDGRTLIVADNRKVQILRSRETDSQKSR